MNRSDRAKQFAPFDALKGLQEALREKERLHERVERKEISEEKQEELTILTSRLSKGKEIRVVFYNEGGYYELKGKVSGVDFVYKYLVVGEGKIFFEDISDLVIL